MSLTLTDSRNAPIPDAGSDVEDLGDVSVLTLSLTNCNYFRNEIVNTVSPLLLLYPLQVFFFSLRYLTPVIFRLETSKENQISFSPFRFGSYPQILFNDGPVRGDSSFSPRFLLWFLPLPPLVPSWAAVHEVRNVITVHTSSDIVNRERELSVNDAGTALGADVDLDYVNKPAGAGVAS